MLTLCSRVASSAAPSAHPHRRSRLFVDLSLRGGGAPPTNNCPPVRLERQVTFYLSPSLPFSFFSSNFLYCKEGVSVTFSSFFSPRPVVSKNPSNSESSSPEEEFLICPPPCKGYSTVDIYMPEDKKNPRSADFRCNAGPKCLSGDRKGDMIYAKSWYKSDKNLPTGFKEAYDNKSMTLLKEKGVEVKPRSMDDIGPGEAPF